MRSEGFGKCHLCRRLRDVQYCSMCEHWFCDDCKKVRFNNLWNRGIEAVKEFVGKQRFGCCGLLNAVLPSVVGVQKEAR